MIDSHCHLDHEPLFKNLNEVILNSKKNGVEKILTICTTVKSFENIITIIKYDNMIYGTFGIHPHETKDSILAPEEIIKPIKENKSDMDLLEEYSYENNKDLWSDYEVNEELKKEKEKRETEILNKKVQIKLQTYLKYKNNPSINYNTYNR